MMKVIKVTVLASYRHGFPLIVESKAISLYGEVLGHSLTHSHYISFSKESADFVLKCIHTFCLNVNSMASSVIGKRP